MKHCPACDTSKPLDAFAVCKGRYDGRQWRCKVCHNGAARAARKVAPGHDPAPNVTEKTCSRCKVVKSTAAEFSKNRGVSDGYSSWCNGCHQKHRRGQNTQILAQRRLKKYGVTQEQVDALFERQGRRCAICPRTEPTSRGWVVDHDHKGGAVRGVLCSPCNVMLGMAQDQPEVLRAGAAYVASFAIDIATPHANSLDLVAPVASAA